MATQGDEQRRAAVGDQRKGQPGDGQQPEHRADVDQRLRRDPGRRADAASRTKGSVVRRAIAHAGVGEAEKSRSTVRVPANPSSSPMTA